MAGASFLMGPGCCSGGGGGGGGTPISGTYCPCSLATTPISFSFGDATGGTSSGVMTYSASATSVTVPSCGGSGTLFTGFTGGVFISPIYLYQTNAVPSSVGAPGTAYIVYGNCDQGWYVTSFVNPCGSVTELTANIFNLTAPPPRPFVYAYICSPYSLSISYSPAQQAYMHITSAVFTQ